MYLDPGFGGMLVQILVAIAAAGGAILFTIRKKIKSLFSRNKQEDYSRPVKKNTNISDDDVIDTLSDENNEDWGIV